MSQPTVVSARAPRMIPLFNPIARFFLRVGVPLGPNGLMTIRGRKTGLLRSTPVAIIEHEGRRWVWCPWGEVQWVQNLRAAGEATVTAHRRAEQVQAIELSPEERVAFVRDVLAPVARSIPFGSRFIRMLDDIDLDQPEDAAVGRCVFELHARP